LERIPSMGSGLLFLVLKSMPFVFLIPKIGKSRNARVVLPVLLVLSFVGCTSSPIAATSLDDFEIGAARSATEPLPAIPLGRVTFRASDPSGVTLAAGKVQFVEFFAYWCAVCKAMAPTVHGLEDLYQEQVSFIYLDRDDPATQALRDQLGYIYQPHFFLLDEQGQVLGEWRGYVDGLVLQQAIVEAVK